MVTHLEEGRMQDPTHSLEIQTEALQKNQKPSRDGFPATKSGMWTCVSNSQGFHNEAQMKLREALRVTYVGKYVYPATGLTLNC